MHTSIYGYLYTYIYIYIYNVFIYAWRGGFASGRCALIRTNTWRQQCTEVSTETHWQNTRLVFAPAHALASRHPLTLKRTALKEGSLSAVYSQLPRYELYIE